MIIGDGGEVTLGDGGEFTNGDSGKSVKLKLELYNAATRYLGAPLRHMGPPVAIKWDRNEK